MHSCYAEARHSQNEIDTKPDVPCPCVLGDQKKKEIIALNPRGTVPVIVDEGPIVVYD